MTHTLSLRRFVLGFAIGAIADAAILAARAYGGTSSASRAPKGTLVTLRKTKLGPVLVDARGRTLYLFEKDRRGKSACGPACAKFWPPLVSRGTVRAGKGVHTSMLGVARRSDGRRQVTYAGHPLYLFIRDAALPGTPGVGVAHGSGITAFGGTFNLIPAQ